MAEETGLVDYTEIMIAGQQIAQDILRRDVHVVEHDRPGVGPAPAKLILVLADDKPGRFLLDYGASIAFISVERGPRHHEVVLRGALRAEDLQTIEAIALAVRPQPGLVLHDVACARGLSHRPCQEPFALGRWHQILLLL